MSEKRILISSILKPVNDTRMFEKLALSLHRMPRVSLHIVGYAAPLPEPVPANIFFYPLFHFKRLSFERVAAQVKYLKKLLQVKPDIIVSSTHELLLISWLYCQFHTCKLVYDIRENYGLNLRSQDNYQPALKKLLSFGVERAERLTASAVSHFLVAERSYVQELPFLEDRFTVVENKYKPHPQYKAPATPVRLPGGATKLLYSGTIATLYGIFEAIALTDKLFKLNPGISLTIIGYCANGPTLKKLKAEISGKPYIKLIGGDRLVPHREILGQMALSDLGLLPYVPNQSTFRCMPTKLFEYMAHGLPMLLQANPYWAPAVEQHDAGFFIDYPTADPERLLEDLQQRIFYTKGIPSTVFWNSEEEKLLQVFNDLLAIKE